MREINKRMQVCQMEMKEIISFLMSDWKFHLLIFLLIITTFSLGFMLNILLFEHRFLTVSNLVHTTNVTFNDFSMYHNGKMLDGLAIGEYLIIVYTKGKTITETLEICTHEYAHTNLNMKD